MSDESPKLDPDPHGDARATAEVNAEVLEALAADDDE